MHTSFFYNDLKPSDVGQRDLFWLRYQGSLVGLCIEDHKSAGGTVTICATLVNIRTDTKTTF